MNERIIYMKIQGSPIDINMIQVHAPTSDLDDDAVEGVRGQTEAHDITIIIGDLDAKVGEGRDVESVGGFGLGERNERGGQMGGVVWEMVTGYTELMYRNPPKYLCTWRSQGYRYRNQIDYFTISKQFCNAATKVKTFPGADCGGNCNHVPVVAVVKLKLKKIKRAKKKVRKDRKALKSCTSRQKRFQLELRNKYQALDVGLDGKPSVITERILFTEALTETAQETIPNERMRRGRQRWMMEEILTRMEERRK